MPLDPELEPHFDEAARLNNLDPTLLRALAGGESNFNANTPPSKKGALGLMQFVPGTARGMGIDPTDPVQEIYGAAKLLGDRLTFHEGRKAASPVDEALRDYFAGSGGGNRGSETAAYPGKIKAYYDQLSGGAPASAAPPSGIDALAAARGPMPPPGQSARNFTPPAGAADTLEAAPIRIQQLAALSGHGTAPTPAGPMTKEFVQQELQKPLPPLNDMLAQLTRDRARYSAEVPSGTDALAQAGRPAAGGSTAAPAGAAPPTDDELLKLFNEVYPTGAKPAGPAQAAGPASGAPATSQVDPAALDAAHANIIRNIRLGRPINPEDAEIVKRAPGMSGDPEYQRELSSATAAGQRQQIRDASGKLVNEPGSTESAATMAGGVVEAQQKEVRKSEADRPTDLPPGHMSMLPTGSPAAEKWIQASKDGFDLPPGITINPNGSVQLFNNPGISKAEDVASDAYGKQKEAFIANQGAVQNLQNFMEAAEKVGTGKGTEFSAKAASWLKAANIDPEKLTLADPAETEKMRKAATQMVFSTIKGVSNRPAYQEFQMLAQGLPNPDLQPEANRAIAASLLGRMNWENDLYRSWDANQRATHSFSAFDMGKWADKNPMSAFQASAYAQTPPIPERTVIGPAKGGAAPQIKDDMVIENKQTGERMIRKGGEWLPLLAPGQTAPIR